MDINYLLGLLDTEMLSLKLGRGLEKWERQ